MKKHWSVDEEKMKREHPDKYRLWRLVFLINDGLEPSEKLDKNEVMEAWPKIKDEIDPYYRRLLEYLLWGKLYSLPPNLTLWNWPPRKKKSSRVSF